MKKYDWDGISKLAGADVRIVALPFKARPMFFEMSKKKQVPPREERMEKIGTPKPPSFGRIMPKAVEVPPVDDLLAEIGKATAKEVTLEYRVISFDLGTEMKPPCSADCGCLPCRNNNCGNCYVDSLVRDGADRDVVRKASTKYRGTVYDD